ncbi:MAG: hypothetical protein NC411_10440 [Bacteroides sp.]|nr:hypothetical protein [Bacteroides sp.]
MNIFQQFFAYLRLREAVRKADEAYHLSGKRHYVLPGVERNLLVMDRRNFRILKRKGYISRGASVNDALVESFYFTPLADGSGFLSESAHRRKVQQYFSWYTARLKEEKKRKRHGKIQREK